MACSCCTLAHMLRRDLCKAAAAALLAPSWIQPAPPVTSLRFSVMLWTLAKLATFERSIEIVSAAGYQGVELVGEFHSWSPEERRRVLARLQGLNLIVDSMSGVRAGFASPASQTTFFTELAAHLQSAVELGCPQVILLSGPRLTTMTQSAQRQIALDNLQRATEMAAARQIEIVIEPIDLIEDPSIFLASVWDAFDLAHAVNSPNLKVLFDLYHEQRSFGNLLEKLENNIASVGLIHVASVPGRHELEIGEINYPAIFAALQKLKYKRWVAMEYLPTSDPTQSLRQSRLEALRWLSN